MIVTRIEALSLRFSKQTVSIFSFWPNKSKLLKHIILNLQAKITVGGQSYLIVVLGNCRKMFLTISISSQILASCDYKDATTTYTESWKHNVDTVEQSC